MSPRDNPVNTHSPKFAVYEGQSLVGYVQQVGRRRIVATEFVGDTEVELGTFPSIQEAARALHTTAPRDA